MKKTLHSALVLLVFLALAPVPASAQTVKHTLQKGETLYSVSRLYKVSYEALAAANGITDPTKVRIGAVLVIPSVHVAAKGETLYGIARQFGLSLSELLAANKLNASYVLKIGDILIIPADTSSETAPSSTTTTAGAKTAATSTTSGAKTGGTS